MRARLKLVFWSIFVCSILFSNETFASEAIYKRLIATQCDSLVKANKTNPNFVILDVRTHGEWVGDHLEGAIYRSTGDADFKKRLDELPKHKTYLLHCKSGGRSAGAFARMKELEFAEVYEMIGGINAWKNANKPTTNLIEPKLMLVDYNIGSGSNTDTLLVTVTNRANGTLTFSSAVFDDLHEITSNFKSNNNIDGAEDYTFSVIHTPIYYGDDSTKINVKSNGGEIVLSVVFKNGVIQSIPDYNINELVIYPNPASEILHIKNYVETSIDEISILNINGQTVMKANWNSISEGITVNQLLQGVYFIRMKMNGQFVSKKFIIKR
jgi:rhodanese-related sulfurtransferase